MELLKKITQLHAELQQSIFTIQEVLTYDQLAGKFIELANAVKAYPGEAEDWCYIGDDAWCGLADMFVGAFWHYTEWHSGQASESYAAYCALSRIVSPGMTTGPEPETSEQHCYDALQEMAEAQQAA